MSCIKSITFLCLTLLLANCALNKARKPSIKQGVYGKVTWLQGNMMPSPDEPKAVNGTPIEREIYIYEAATFKDIVGQAPLFTAVNKKLVKIVRSNKDGYYECELPVGNYSIFSLEPEGSFFANSFDGQGLINSVQIQALKMVNLDVQINYRASY